MEEILELQNSIDRIKVRIDRDGKVQTVIPEKMTGMEFARWRKDKGGVFLTDVRNWVRGKLTAEYLLLDGDGKQFILRLVDDEEVSEFQLRKIINGKIKDRYYIQMVNLTEPEEERNFIFEYIDEPEDEDSDYEPEDLDLEEDEVDEDEDNLHPGSISLFDE